VQSSLDSISADVLHNCTLSFSFGSTLSAHVLPSLHTFILIWIHYQLMYCHHCTLLSSFGSTISSCTVITAHCNLQLDLLSASVLPTITAQYYPISAGVLQILYTVILYGSTISVCTIITAHCNPHCSSLISCSTNIMAHCYPYTDSL